MKYPALTLLLVLIIQGSSWAIESLSIAEKTAHASAPALSEVITTALEKAPVLPAARARHSSAKTMITSSTALPDPYIELTGQAMGVSPIGPSSSLVLEYRQELPFPGKRASRKASAEAYAITYEKEIDDIKAYVIEEVSIHYANLYALDRELGAINDAENLVLSAKRAATVRYSSGFSGKSALVRLDLEASRLRQRKAGVVASRLTEVALLNRYIGASPDAPFGEVIKLPALTPESMLNIEQRIDSSPGIARVRAKADAALLKMKELKLDERPDFMVGGGGGIDGDDNPVVMLRMGVKLPLFRENKQGIATQSAMHEYKAAQAELEDVRSQLRTQAAVLEAELNKTGIIIKEYSESIIPNSKAVFDASLAAYASGLGDYSTLIEDLNALIVARTELAKTEAERFTVSARLERLTGSPEEKMPYGRNP